MLCMLMVGAALYNLLPKCYVALKLGMGGPGRHDNCIYTTRNPVIAV